MPDKHSSFANPVAIESYARDVPRKVPGLHDLHRMAVVGLVPEELFKFGDLALEVPLAFAALRRQSAQTSISTR